MLSYLFGGKKKSRNEKQKQDQWTEARETMEEQAQQREEEIRKIKSRPQYEQDFNIKGVTAYSSWGGVRAAFYLQGRIDTFEYLRAWFADAAIENDDYDTKQLLMRLSQAMDGFKRIESDEFDETLRKVDKK